MVSHLLFLNSFKSFSFHFINQWIGGWIDCHLESVGNGRDETETDSSSKTFGRFAVVFTRRAIPRFIGCERRNNNLVDRGEELAGKDVQLGVCGVFLLIYKPQRFIEQTRTIFILFTFLFPSLFRLGRLFSSVHEIVQCTRVSRGCHSTR